MKMYLVYFFFLVMLLSGCAGSNRKQAAQPRAELPAGSYQQERYDYDDSDMFSPESYEKPAKKAYAGQATQLGPKQIQRALKNAGFYSGAVDGKIGPKTREAIAKFQKAKGLKADGIAGKKTSAELNKYLSR